MSKKRKSTQERVTERSRHRILSDYWDSRIRAGKEAKREYTRTANEVMQYFKAKHDFLYQNEAAAFMDFDGSSTVSVPMIAKMKNSLGPRLYVAAPTREVIPRSPDGMWIGFGRAVGAYLTYTAREARFAKTMRNTIDDGLLRGRAMLRLTWDEVRKIIISTHLSSKDFVFDPDFERIEDAQWIAIRHHEPLWSLKRRIAKWKIKGLEEQDTLGTDRLGSDPSRTLEAEGEEQVPPKKVTATTVEWWEILSKMGSGARGADMTTEIRALDSDEEDNVRLAVVQGHHFLLEEGDWDVPLYLDQDWPISFTDFVETPDSAWPQSCMGQVLPLQKAADLLSSLRLSSCKNRDRVVMFIDKKLAPEVQEQLRRGSSADAIPVSLPQGHTLDMVMKIADFGQGASESLAERDFCMKEVEETVGITEMVTGGQPSGAQDRSATATQLRNSAAEVRSADLENKVEELMTDAARKEALAIRLFLSEEDFSKIVQASDINMFYVQVSVPGGAEIPLRPARFSDDDESNPSRKPKPLTMVDVAPAGATYFDQPTAAAEAMAKVWQEMLATADPEVAQIRDTLLSEGLSKNLPGGVDPMTGIPPGLSVQLVDAKKVWRDTAGLTAEELMRELSYEIQASPGVKFDKAAERASADNLLQIMPPIFMQLGDIQGLNALLARRDEAYQVPPDKRLQITPPPAPPQQNVQGPKSEKPNAPA
jgi:hypothetical protein